MKFKLASIFFLLTISLHSFAQSEKMISLKNNQEFIFSELIDHVTILQFWASWCVSCDDMMLKLDHFSRNKQNQLKFIPISVDENIDDAKSYFKKAEKLKKIRDQSFLDSKLKISERLKIKAIPTILFLDRSGKIVSRFEGHPSQKDLEQAFLKAKKSI